MLHSAKDLEGCAIRATDGLIGHVKDLYFDDQVWVIRYLVVDTGTWLSSRKVLISPFAVKRPNWLENEVPVSIAMEKVKNSPDIDTDKPVSRQHEKQYLRYFGFPYYWAGGGLWGLGAYPGAMLMRAADGGAGTELRHAQMEDDRAEAEAERREDHDLHLRSYEAVRGYYIVATDGDIGRVQGLLLDEQTWAIRYLIVDAGDWWQGHTVLIAPQWIKDVSWPNSTVVVKLTQQSIRDAPPYDSSVPLDREQELRIFKHYGYPGYWAEEHKVQNVHRAKATID